MDNTTFLTKTKEWINNKIILSNTSQWYKTDAKRRSAIIHIQDKFATFLQFPAKFSVHQLAILLKRHEDLLLTVLPIPNNPSYEQAFNGLVKILKYATDIIEDKDLKHML